MPEAGGNNVWTRLLTVVASGLATISLAGSGFLLDSALERLQSLEQTQRRLEVSIARYNNHVQEHEKQSEYWIQRIESNTNRLGRLATDSAARPDPFTGTQGRELERRLDFVERIVDQIELLKKDVQILQTR